MNTNKIRVALSAALVAAMTGCASFPELSDGQKRVIKENKARAAIALAEDGRLVAVDENGKALTRCTLEADGKGELKQCTGLQKGFAVKNLNTLSVIRSKKNPECAIIVDIVYGFAQEICW
jgi:hypothetical protein